MHECVQTPQNTEKALITPWGVDWMSYTAEDSSFPSMCLTFTRKVITRLALDTLQYPILSLTFRKAIYNNKCRKGTMRKTNSRFNNNHACLGFCMTAHSLGKLLKSDGSFLCGRPIDSFPHMGIPGISLLHMGKEIRSQRWYLWKELRFTN